MFHPNLFLVIHRFLIFVYSKNVLKRLLKWESSDFGSLIERYSGKVDAERSGHLGNKHTFEKNNAGHF